MLQLHVYSDFFHTALQIVTQPSVTEECRDSVTLSIYAVGVGSVSYQWMKDNAQISDDKYHSGANKQNIQIKKPKKCAGQYFCVVYDSCKHQVTSKSIKVPPGKHLTL